MSRQNDIDDSIWSDPPFHALSPDAKLVYVWSFTNERVGMAGIYKVPFSTIQHELGLQSHDLETALADLRSAGFVFYDGTWLWVRSRVKRLRTRTVQMCRSVAKQVANVPADQPFRVALLYLYGDAFWASTDTRTTLCQELGITRVVLGSDPGFPAPRRNSGYHPSTTTVVQGQGQGQGKGLGVGGSGGKGIDRRAWAAEHLPDLPLEVVCMTLTRLVRGSRELTPELVRREVLANHPSLAENVHPLPGGKAA